MSLTGFKFAIAVLAGLYVAVGLLLYVFQARLIYHPNVPTRTLGTTPDAYGLDFKNVEIETEDRVRLHGWFVPAAGTPRGVVLFFHGNAGNISHRLDSIKIFNDLQLAVFIIDYRGYGQSDGKVSEKGTYLDAEAAWNYLTRRQNFQPKDIIVFGRSLGSAIAANIAAKHKPAALVMESGFTSVPELAAELYPIFPVRWLARIRYPAIEFLRDVNCPVLIVHSADDEIIPFQYGRNLYEAANGPKTFLEIQGGHNEGFLASGRTYIEGIDTFLNEHLKQ